MEDQFDYAAFNKQLIEDIRSGKSLIGKEGIFTPLIKKALEGSLKAELEEHLAATRETEKNRKNGKSSKRVKSQLGEFELESIRDRNGTFEPRILEKRQIKLSKDFDEKIICLYGLPRGYKNLNKGGKCVAQQIVPNEEGELIRKAFIGKLSRICPI